MAQLGTLEDLPSRYLADLTDRNLVPLWPSLRALLPRGRPARKTAPTVWHYARRHDHGAACWRRGT